uniref:Putative structural protein n=1 Tax=viral metagenome TaxID=1070528 RepID=A0A6M3KF42_9ZZZZ
MNFDLNTALAVREREDGLLEKDTFNLSMARSVAEIRAAMPGEIPYSPPAIKERANVELAYREAGLPVPAGLKLEWDLTSPQAQAATGVVATTVLTGGLNLAVQGIRGVADKESKGNLFDKAFKGIVYPEATARLYQKLPGTKDLPPWAKLTADIADDIISYGVVSITKGALKETLLAKDIYRKLDVPATAYAKDKMKGFLPAGQLTEKQAFEGYKQEYRNIALKKFTAIEAELVASEEAIGAGQGGGPSQLQEYARKRSLLGLIIDDLKHTNNKGQLQLPKVGQSIGFKNPKGEISEGIIRKVTGEIAEIELLNQPGRIIVATLSQLSLPQAPETPVLPPKEVQISPKAEVLPTGEGKVVYRGTVGIGEIENIQSGKAKYIEGETGGMWTEDIKSAENYGKGMSLAQGSSTLKPTGAGNYILEGIKDSKGIITPTKATNIKTGEVIQLSTPAEGKAVEPPVIEQGPIIKNLNISEESKTNVQSLAEEVMPELEKVKGKTLSHDEVVEAAVSSDILTRVIDRQQSKEVEAALLRTRQHLASMAEQKGVSEDFIKTLKIVKSFGTDAARKLSSLRIGAGASEFNIKTKLINKLTELGVDTDKIIRAAQGIDFNNQDQVMGFYRQFVKPKFSEILNEYRYINLLSSPRTHIVNTFSNLLQVSGLAPATKLASGTIDVIHGMLKPGLQRTHYLSEVPAYLKGALNSIGEAGSKALDALKGKSFVERPDVTHIPTGSKLLKPFRYIPQALEASDVFFRTIAYQGELESQLSKGINREEAEKLAKDKASYWVFRKALDPQNITGQGKLLSAIDGMTTLIYKSRKIPIIGKAISWFLPFVQTPMNIAKQMIEFSPLGGTTIPGAKDKTEQAGKMLIGSLITAMAGYLIAQNDSTWEMPTSKKEKELFIASGKIPYAIKLGGTWYSYSRLGPIAFPIALAAATKYHFSQSPNSVTDTNLQKFTKVISGLGNFFAQQSYVQGIGDLMEVVKNSPGATAKFISNIPSQIIPLSSLQRWVNNIIDPVFRKSDKDISIESILDNSRKNIAGMTKGMEAYQTPDEEDSKRSMPIINAFSPIPMSQAKDDSEYKDYIEQRKESLIDKKESGDEPKTKKRGRVR